MLDHTGRQINHNYDSHNNLKIEKLFLPKFNNSYFDDIVNKLKKTLLVKDVDDRFVINKKNAIDLDKLIRLACTARNESEKNIRLRTSNNILENKCAKYDHAINEIDRFKYMLDSIVINLCLALGRRVDDKEDVMHLINVCAALNAHENDNQYVLMENNNIRYSLEKKLANIKTKTLYSYDDLLKSIEKFKEQIIVKDRKLTQLTNDLHTAKVEIVDKNCAIQSLKDTFSCDLNWINEEINNGSDNYELHEGKLLIAAEINELDGYGTFEIKNYSLSDLVKMLLKSILERQEQLEAANKSFTQHIENENYQLIKELNDHKEWKKYLENENEKLHSKIENLKQVRENFMNKENELIVLKEENSKMNFMIDELNGDLVQLKLLTSEYQSQLKEKQIKCTDNDNLIKLLKSNLTNQTNELERISLKLNEEREKCICIENQTLKMVEDFNHLTIQYEKKNEEIVTIRDEYFILKEHASSADAEIENLKENIIVLENVLAEKNRNTRDMHKKSRLHLNTVSSCEINSLLQHLSILEQQMDVILHDMSTCKNVILQYEMVLNNLQNAIKKQSITKNYWRAKYQNTKKNTHKILRKKINEEKELLIMGFTKEIESWKEKFNLKITHLIGIIYYLLIVGTNL